MLPNCKPTRGIRLNKSHPLARGLVGCWLFNEGSGNKVFDLSSNGNAGTIGSGFTWGSGDFGSVITGTAADRIVIANESFFDFERTDSFSLVIRFKSTAFADSLLGKMANSAPYTGWDVEIDGAGGHEGKITFYLINDWAGENRIQTRSTNTYNDGLEHTVICTYDGSSTAAGAKIYIDGSEETNTVTDALSASILNNIAVGIAGRSGGEYHAGSVGFGMVYNRVLTFSEIALLYREPFCMFERRRRGRAACA